MTGKQAKYIRETVENEGSVEYTFVNYSDFEDIKDAEFHKLRAAYVSAHKALVDYCGLED